MNGWQAFRVRWSPRDPNFLYFWGGGIGGSTAASLYKVEASGAGAPQRVFLELVGADFDMGRPSSSGPAMIVSAGRDAVVYNDFVFYPALNLSQTALAHFNCKNDAVIGRDFRTRREGVAITTLSPRSTVTWSTDSAIHETDWMPRVPCL